ncbi:1-acyl-sn-glycerol-3-phosphate acyltransferase [Chamaesiphon sp. VAR_69_metabat_338]|uniref:1-acyl-sn-glycerol-3-phosphate acyltransferase n=1 Tax=Chamaesiphon sp. VAR_69_metabat_338 TaxID=2964704 RepID=UPI00286DFE37|nr:1-acyl-sn-glycerol-3-phosphate acyltransferase [Chamaesiphon sp. VAR_69_metabat_338]
MTGSELTNPKSDNSKLHSSQPVQSRVSPWLTKIIHPLGRYVVLPGFFREIEIIGKQYTPHTGAVILAPTHRTRWDALLIAYAIGPYVTGRSSRIMVTTDEMKGIQGWFLRRLGCFEIDTTKTSPAVIRHSIELLHQGEMLTIFPEGGEGTMFRDRVLHPIKEGLTRIATQALSLKPDLDLKIIPINLDYEHLYPKFRDRVTIELGKPLQVNDYQQFSSKTGAKKLHEDLVRSLEELTASSKYS